MMDRLVSWGQIQVAGNNGGVEEFRPHLSLLRCPHYYLFSNTFLTATTNSPCPSTAVLDDYPRQKVPSRYLYSNVIDAWLLQFWSPLSHLLSSTPGMSPAYTSYLLGHVRSALGGKQSATRYAAFYLQSVQTISSMCLPICSPTISTNQSKSLSVVLPHADRGNKDPSFTRYSSLKYCRHLFMSQQHFRNVRSQRASHNVRLAVVWYEALLMFKPTIHAHTLGARNFQSFEVDLSQIVLETPTSRASSFVCTILDPAVLGRRHSEQSEIFAGLSQKVGFISTTEQTQQIAKIPRVEI
ncbi:hypothetical protein GJ744_002166 [Endocarpon pusillum]|uniref:Uncharacterized protein n=1 Tax=Endocarpon pusillum TaxID=364733 RepID=A0A8H7AC95_9EURO|nr:hypothetical protein GJ744_002166 [Endocarpon pusillum]